MEYSNYGYGNGYGGNGYGNGGGYGKGGYQQDYGSCPTFTLYATARCSPLSRLAAWMPSFLTSKMFDMCPRALLKLGDGTDLTEHCIA